MATYLVRHGESEGNCHRGYYGRLDTLLTEQGMEQAREAAHELSELLKDNSAHEVAIFTSPLQRAFRTACILEENLDVPCRIEVVPYLTEIDFGRWEGMDYEEIKEKYPEIPASLIKEIVTAQYQNQDNRTAGRTSTLGLIQDYLRNITIEAGGDE